MWSAIIASSRKRFTDIVQPMIDAFRERVLAFPGIFETETCLKTQLDSINDIGLLQDATIVITPNGYNENILHTVKGNTITSPPYNLASYTESSTNIQNTNIVISGVITEPNPIGGNTVIRIAENTTNANHRWTSLNLFNIKTSTDHTFSVFIKKGSGATAPDVIQVFVQIAGANNTAANFNLATGVVTNPVNCTASMTDVGLPAGWWRCSITRVLTPGVSNLAGISFCNNDPNAAINPAYAGLTTTDIFFTGLQCEEGLTATTYQPVLFTQLLEQGYAEHIRTTTGYRTESTGLVREVPQENLIRHSSDFIQSTWAKQNGCTITNKIVLAPDGVNYADGVNFTTDILSRVEQQNIPIGVGLDYTFSVWLRADSSMTLNMIMTNTQAINITTSWQRFSITITAASTATTPQIRNNGATAKAFYMWGAQMSLGNTVIPYYPTRLRTNTPKLDYEYQSCPDLLLEQTSINVCIRSEEFENIAWNKSNLTVTSNSETAPNGLLVADTLTATANDAYISINAAQIATVRKVYSIYLKRKTGVGSVTLEVGEYISTVSINSSTWTRCYVITDSPPTSNYTIVSGLHTITTPTPHNLNTGDSIRFLRLTGDGINVNTIVTVSSPTEFTFSSGALTTNGTCVIYVHAMRIKIHTSGDEIYAWGSQFENTATTLQNNYYEPTSYIPTTSAAVTRTLDNLAVYKIQENNLLNNSYSLFWEIRKIGGANSQDYHIGLSDTVNGFINDAIFINGLPLGGRKMDGGVNTTLTSLGVYQPSSTNYYKGLITCNNGVFEIWIDGTKLVNTTSVNYQNLKLVCLRGVGISRFKQVLGWNRVLNRTEIDLLFAYPYYNAGYTPSNNELQQIINRAYAEGFTIPSTTILGHCDTLITEMKNDGVWNVGDAYFNFAYNDVTLSDWSRINWFRPNSKLNAIATLIGGLTYRVDGFKGNGIDGYVDTLINPSTAIPYNYSLNNAGRMLVISEDVSNGNTVYEGNTGTSTRMGSFLSSLSSFTINSFNSAAATIDTTGVGLKSIMRDSSTDIRIQNGINTLSTTQTSVIITNNSQLILRFANSYSNGCVSNYYMGASISNTQIDNFRTYYNTYLTNIGLTAFA
jgi:hypothetical protein